MTKCTVIIMKSISWSNFPVFSHAVCLGLIKTVVLNVIHLIYLTVQVDLVITLFCLSFLSIIHAQLCLRPIEAEVYFKVLNILQPTWNPAEVPEEKVPFKILIDISKNANVKCLKAQLAKMHWNAFLTSVFNETTLGLFIFFRVNLNGFILTPVTQSGIWGEWDYWPILHSC